MSKHVEHLLAAYVEQQLQPKQAAYVYRHVIECPGCRSALARHERLASELRMSLGQWPALRPGRVQQLWLAASTPTITPANRQNTTALLPLLLSLVLLLVPFTTGFSGMIPSTALVATASHSPGKAAAQALPNMPKVETIPPPESQQASLTLEATPPIVETPLPARPVPLAPSNP
jgi:anti-sigma factor RsiW